MGKLFALVGLLGLVGACSSSDDAAPADASTDAPHDGALLDAGADRGASDAPFDQAVDTGADTGPPNPLETTCDPTDAAATCPDAEGSDGFATGAYCMTVHTSSTPDMYGRCTFLCSNTDAVTDMKMKQVCAHLGGICGATIETQPICIPKQP